MIGGVQEHLDLRACLDDQRVLYKGIGPGLNPRPSCSSPPPQVIQAIWHSREPHQSKPRLVAGQRRGARTSSKVSGVPIH
jgi:hypothetical protein